jgi:hypothetical protein
VKQLIENAFPCQTGNCFEVRSENIFWIDEYQIDDFPSKPKGKSFIILEKEGDKLFFTVNNLSQKEVIFLAIDKGIFLDTLEFDFKKCDFALFDDERFCFIESKDVNLKHRRQERLDAYEQLKNTILKFKEKIDFGDYILEAQISMKASQIYPRQRSSNENKVKEFEDDLRVALFENNDIEF